MDNIENYRAIPLSSVPDCCGVCAYGDIDGEGCNVLIENDFGITEKQLNTGFNYFFVCDQFRRTQHNH